MMNLIFWNPRPTCWCLKFGSFVCCCNINERTAQCSFSWAAELEQFSDELQMVESMFSLFCLFLSHMATSHWRGDSGWLTATVVLKQWGSGLCTPWGASSSCCSENNCARGKRSVWALWPTWEGRWLCAGLLLPDIYSTLPWGSLHQESHLLQRIFTHSVYRIVIGKLKTLFSNILVPIKLTLDQAKTETYCCLNRNRNKYPTLG